MPSKAILISLAVIGVSAVAAGALYASRQKPAKRRRRRRRGQLGSSFREPADAADAKRQLQKLKKSLKKARDERADAERSSYAMGVRVADDRIGELEAAEQHFQRWLATRSLGSAGSQALVPVINAAYGAARADVDTAAQDIKHAVRAGLKRLDAAQAKLDKLQKHVENALPEEEGDDPDLLAVYDEMEYEGMGMYDPKEEDAYGSLMAGAAELLRLGRKLERRRRKLEAVATR